MSVLTHDCNVIKFQLAIPSNSKYYHENLPLNNLHKEFYLELIHTLNFLKIEIKGTLICS